MVKSQLHWEHLPDACISTLTWTLVAVVISFGLFRHRSLVYSNRVVSLLHALVALPLCIRAARHWNPLPHFGHRTTAPEVSPFQPETCFAKHFVQSVPLACSYACALACCCMHVQ